MANVAAHLVDRVLPPVPVRQWVLSLPFELLEGRSQEPAPQTSLDACAGIATQRGAMRALREDPQADQERTEGMAAPPVDKSAVEDEGFNLHASVVIAADDDLGPRG